MSKFTKILIIGAGPIGIEACLKAKQHGWDHIHLEKGSIGDAVKRWGQVKMFSPFGMNHSSGGRTLLESQGYRLPSDSDFLTGLEYVKSYLAPLGSLLGTKENHLVKAISRRSQCKGDNILAPKRTQTPFRVLVEHDGEESEIECEIILDCTGVLDTPNPLGDGGIPAVGESRLKDRIQYGLADLPAKSHFKNRNVLLVGTGHSAANLATQLAEFGVSRLIWLSRNEVSQPQKVFPNDPLSERARVCEEANLLINRSNVEFHPTSTVDEIQSSGHQLLVKVKQNERTQEFLVDEVISATGYRPDPCLCRELQVQTCWATEGTYPLAASLLGESAGDCLTLPSFGVDTLRHPEPNYYALGIKSYGRTPDFLIQAGLKQVADVFETLS